MAKTGAPQVREGELFLVPRYGEIWKVLRVMTRAAEVEQGPAALPFKPHEPQKVTVLALADLVRLARVEES